MTPIHLNKLLRWYSLLVCIFSEIGLSAGYQLESQIPVANDLKISTFFLQIVLDANLQEPKIDQNYFDSFHFNNSAVEELQSRVQDLIVSFGREYYDLQLSSSLRLFGTSTVEMELDVGKTTTNPDLDQSSTDSLDLRTSTSIADITDNPEDNFYTTETPTFSTFQDLSSSTEDDYIIKTDSPTLPNNISPTYSPFSGYQSTEIPNSSYASTITALSTADVVETMSPTQSKDIFMTTNSPLFDYDFSTESQSDNYFTTTSTTDDLVNASTISRNEATGSPTMTDDDVTQNFWTTDKKFLYTTKKEDFTTESPIQLEATEIITSESIAYQTSSPTEFSSIITQSPKEPGTEFSERFSPTSLLYQTSASTSTGSPFAEITFSPTEDIWILVWGSKFCVFFQFTTHFDLSAFVNFI